MDHDRLPDSKTRSISVEGQATNHLTARIRGVGSGENRLPWVGCTAGHCTPSCVLLERSRRHVDTPSRPGSQPGHDCQDPPP